MPPLSKAVLFMIYESVRTKYPFKMAIAAPLFSTTFLSKVLLMILRLVLCPHTPEP